MTTEIIQEVGFRIAMTKCRKCGSDNVNVVWRCEEPGVVSYECQQSDCLYVLKLDTNGLPLRVPVA